MDRFREITEQTRHVKDLRLVLYEVVEVGMAVLFFALLTRLFFFQAFTVPSPAMEGTLLPGDRFFANRLVYGLKLPFSDKILLRFKRPRMGEVAVFRDPGLMGRLSVRRCIAGPGQTVHLTDKKVFVDGAEFRFPATARSGGTVSIEERFSPRDTFHPFRIPQPGERIRIDTLPLREFDFLSSLIRQENPESRFTITADLMKGNLPCDLPDLADLRMDLLQQDSLPSLDRMNWIQLSNVLNFLTSRGDSAVYSIRRVLYRDGVQVKEYPVRRRHFFFMGDNWDDSEDSRFTGLIMEDLIVARASFTYWSASPQGGLRWSRLFLFL